MATFIVTVMHIFSFAVEGQDYDGATASVTFPTSSSCGATACANINIRNDEALECTQEFSVAITSSSLPTLIINSQSSATITINGDES